MTNAFSMIWRCGVVVMASALWASGTLATDERAIQFPDVPGFRTVVVDLHTHSVFSDGLVWP
ncbi:MAG TPA: hypothetical protein EYN90_04960, partial [Acidobacteria bacterium]|nr:hypothetical protein [Acidobacteriota bacterium]